jgi:hypothetical protein
MSRDISTDAALARPLPVRMAEQFELYLNALREGRIAVGAVFGSDVKTLACGSTVRAVIDSSGAVPVPEWRLDDTGASA